MTDLPLCPGCHLPVLPDGTWLDNEGRPWHSECIRGDAKAFEYEDRED